MCDPGAHRTWRVRLRTPDSESRWDRDRSRSDRQVRQKQIAGPAAVPGPPVGLICRGRHRRGGLTISPLRRSARPWRRARAIPVQARAGRSSPTALGGRPCDHHSRKVGRLPVNIVATAVTSGEKPRGHCQDVWFRCLPEAPCRWDVRSPRSQCGRGPTSVRTERGWAVATYIYGTSADRDLGC